MLGLGCQWGRQHRLWGFQVLRTGLCSAAPSCPAPPCSKLHPPHPRPSLSRLRARLPARPPAHHCLPRSEELKFLKQKLKKLEEKMGKDGAKAEALEAEAAQAAERLPEPVVVSGYLVKEQTALAVLEAWST